ncbi:MAG: DNA translocase FtsK 4TM domain-containing protein [Hyphomicrobiales bacterium]|nr:DNA translocase FtsK 4TM domain-containing protein [Hyphomicrobiales bacterium]
MRLSRSRHLEFTDLIGYVRVFIAQRVSEIIGIITLVAVIATSIALVTWSAQDPSLNQAINRPVNNFMGHPGAILSDILMQLFGLASLALVAPAGFLGLKLVNATKINYIRWRLFFWVIGALSTAAILGALPIIGSWPLPIGLGGIVGDAILAFIASLPPVQGLPIKPFALLAFGLFALLGLAAGSGVSFSRKSSFDDEIETDDEWSEEDDSEVAPSLTDRFKNIFAPFVVVGRVIANLFSGFRSSDDATEATRERRSTRREPGFDYEPSSEIEQIEDEPVVEPRRPRAPVKTSKPKKSSTQLELYTFPPVGLLTEAKKSVGPVMSSEALEENARQLESVLDDFGVKGDVGNVRPGPVVTLYELEPAPGIKSSRVVGLADDIARSMSAVSARVAVVPGRNAIGIELPNQKRETVYLRELINNKDFVESQMKLALALGKTIGGEPVIVDLARMPHLLVAGTTGSGKSVAINTMILSLLYRLKPEECRLIMVDPKMLELSVYDGIPHLLTPVVTDPRKAVVALKWAVREMEERYKKMSKLGVRNIDGFNARVGEAKAKGEQITRTVQTGFDRDTGEAIFENEVMDLEPLPFIVVIVDEMADLMMVAGKDIEGAIQRLAQMARAAGIHVILATQRPSVDVITGTIKANFPTRISFQVTSKIDSRTILGEQGAEQLLGQGDMLFMAGGGRISRVHGPFVSDGEVEKVVAHLKSQGRPNYLEDVTREDQADVEDGGAVFDNGSFGSAGQDLYDQAVAIVLRDRKASTSYIQRRLQIGYNRAASIMERMEDEGVVGAPNHAGKREILMEAGGHGSHAA